jgi:hypothetical protein
MTPSHFIYSIPGVSMRWESSTVEHMYPSFSRKVSAFLSKLMAISSIIDLRVTTQETTPQDVFTHVKSSPLTCRCIRIARAMSAT